MNPDQSFQRKRQNYRAKPLKLTAQRTGLKVRCNEKENYHSVLLSFVHMPGWYATPRACSPYPENPHASFKSRVSFLVDEIEAIVSHFKILPVVAIPVERRLLSGSRS